MISVTSKTLFDDLQATPSFLQSVLDEASKKTQPSFATATVNFISSWFFPSYHRLLQARENRTMHIFSDKSCLFDYTKEKSGGISGIYPTIHGHKIAFYPYKSSRHELVQNCFETAYFEISNKDQLQIIEYFKDSDGELDSHTWTVHNPLHSLIVDDKRESCYWGNLVKV